MPAHTNRHMSRCSTNAYMSRNGFYALSEMSEAGEYLSSHQHVGLQACAALHCMACFVAHLLDALASHSAVVQQNGYAVRSV